MNKTREELRNELLRRLSENTGINITDEGSIALAIADALIDEVHNLYREVDFISRQSYISTSSHKYTDMISELVGIEREVGESDDNLKIRAKNSIYQHSGGNIIAIEEAAKSVSGVAKIDYRPYGRGTGSFIVFVYPQPHAEQERLLDRVREALSEVVSEGIYYEVKAPTEVPVNLELIVQYSEETTVPQRNTIRRDIERALRDYINNLEMNEVLYINELISRAMNIDETILDVSIIKYEVDDVSRPQSNTYPANEERFISGQIQVN